jgi:hypothetical protein
VQLNDGRARIGSTAGLIDVHDCVYGVLGAAGQDPNGRGKLVIDHATLHHHAADGAAVGMLIASDVDASGNAGQGLGAASMARVRHVTANDNPRGHGIFAGRMLKANGVAASGNITGLESWGRVAASDVTATANQYFGVAGDAILLLNATVLDNGIADILSRRFPRLVEVTCGRSIDYDSVSWGVCANGSPSGAFVDAS